MPGAGPSSAAGASCAGLVRHARFVLLGLLSLYAAASSGCGLAYPIAGVIGAARGGGGGRPSGSQSASDGTKPLVDAVPGWGGGCFLPSVNLGTGNLHVTYPMIDVPAKGPELEFGLFYNSTLSAEATTVGSGWSHAYDISLQVDVPDPASITVRWADGRRDVFVDDGSGWAADPALEGRRITTITGGYRLRTKHGLNYDFDTSGRLGQLIDRNSNVMTFAYDGLNRLSTVTDATGRSCTLSYDAQSHVVSVTGQVQVQLEYAVDRLIRVIWQGFMSEFEYDGLDRLVRLVDYDGDAVTVKYYTGLPVVEEVKLGDALRVYTYDSLNRITRVTDARDSGEWSVTAFQFDLEGLCLSVDDGPMGVTQNTYDPVTNNRTSYTDADGHTTSWTYDALGNRLTETDALGHSLSMTYDPVFNLLISLTDKKGETWTFQRDGNGNLLVFEDPLGNQVVCTYTPQGLPASRLDERGFVTSYTYDAYGNLASVTDPAGFSMNATYNVRGALLSVQDQEGNVTMVGRDAADRAVTITPPIDGSYNLTWTPTGQLRSLQDPTGATYNFTYDSRKLLVRRTDPMGGLFTLVRNRAGNVIRAVDALGKMEHYAYDAADRLIRRTDADGGVWSYLHGCCDLLAATDALGMPTTFEYTVRHELRRILSPDTQTDYAYDAASRLVSADLTNPPEPLISYTFTYDDADRRTGATAAHLSRTAQFVLDPAGTVVQLDDNLRPGIVRYAYDNRGLATTLDPGVGGATATMGHTPRRQLAARSHAGGVIVNYGYDARNRLATIVNQGAGFTANYGIGYDSRGLRVSVSANTPATGSLTQQVVFDPNRRPVHEVYLPAAPMPIQYSYDAVGNRLTRAVAPNPPETYTYTSGHRLLTGGSTNQVWNANGNVIQLTEPGLNIAYSYRSDRAIQSITRNGETWRFHVGPFGEVARVVLPSGQERWYVSDVSDGGLVRRAVLPGPGLTPSEEFVELSGGLDRAPSGLSSGPIGGGFWLQAPFTPVNARAVLPGPSGAAEVADDLGNLLSDRYYELFGKVRAQIGSQHPTSGFLEMHAEPGLPAPIFKLSAHKSGFDATLFVRPQFLFVRPQSMFTNVDNVIDPYYFDTGSFQLDSGFGPDGLFPGGFAEGFVWPGFILNLGNLAGQEEPQPKKQEGPTITTEDLVWFAEMLASGDINRANAARAAYLRGRVRPLYPFTPTPVASDW